MPSPIGNNGARAVPLRARRFAVIASFAALLGACHSDNRPPPRVVTPPPPVNAAPVTRTIDASGGTIVGPNGITLTIPQGALQAATDITIAVDPAARRLDLPAGIRTDDEAVVLTPHGTTFSVPVTISIPFEPSSVPAGQVPHLMKTNAAGGDVQQLVAVQDGTMLRAAITSFSETRRFYCPPEPLGCSAIAIVRQPQGGSVQEGGSWQFEVEVLTTSAAIRPLSYQWVRGENQMVIPHATNPTLLVQNITLAEEDVPYRVIVSLTDNDGNATTASLVSEPAALRIAPTRPRLVPDLADVQVAVGEDAHFSVGLQSAAPLTNVQWWRGTADTNGGVTFLIIPGEANTDYVLRNAQLSDDGARFRIIAANSAGAVESRIATLSVIPGPVQPSIRQQPQALSVTAGSSAIFTVHAEGGRLTYSWERRDSGGSFEPLANPAATLTISNAALDDNGAEFRVTVSNSVGSVMSEAVQLAVGLPRGQAVRRVGGGLRYSVGLRADGRLLSWGNNSAGELGDGTRVTRTSPVEVLGLSRVASLSVGVGHSLAVLDTGAVWGWGGRAGLGLDADADTPVPLAELGPNGTLGPARLAAASLPPRDAYSLIVLDRSGQVWGLGGNMSGQLGDGTTFDRSRLGQVGTLTGVVSVAAGAGHALALLGADGSVWAWGRNDFGQLGDGSQQAQLHPIQIPMPARIVAIFAGTDSSYALDVDGTVWAWGRNTGVAALGDVESHAERADRLTPVRVLLPGPAADLAIGDEHALALLADGRVFSWGRTLVGQCGCGDAGMILRPQQVMTPPLPEDIRAIGTGVYHVLALEEDGDVWTWGSNERGQISGGVDTQPLVHEPLPIQVPGVNLGALNTSFTLAVGFNPARPPSADARLTAVFEVNGLPGAPAGIDCTPASDPQGDDCRETYAVGTVVRVRATNLGESVQWLNCPDEFSPFECRVVMSADLTLSPQ